MSVCQSVCLFTRGTHVIGHMGLYLQPQPWLHPADLTKLSSWEHSPGLPPGCVDRWEVGLRLKGLLVRMVNTIAFVSHSLDVYRSLAARTGERGIGEMNHTSDYITLIAQTGKYNSHEHIQPSIEPSEFYLSHTTLAKLAIKDYVGKIKIISAKRYL